MSCLPGCLPRGATWKKGGGGKNQSQPSQEPVQKMSGPLCKNLLTGGGGSVKKRNNTRNDTKTPKSIWTEHLILKGLKKKDKTKQ